MAIGPLHAEMESVYYRVSAARENWEKTWGKMGHGKPRKSGKVVTDLAHFSVSRPILLVESESRETILFHPVFKK